MEKRIIYFDQAKAFLNLLVGVAILIGDLFFVPGMFKLIGFFVGGSFIYFGSKSLSGKPQLIISDENLFIGFRSNKTIPWKNIKKVSVKEKSVDFRLLKFLEITLWVKSNGPVNTMVKQFPIDNLDTSSVETVQLIQDRLSAKSNSSVFETFR